jgi:hypothetical protein
MKLSVKKALLAAQAMVKRRYECEKLVDLANLCLPRGWKLDVTRAEFQDAVKQFGTVEALRLLARPVTVEPRKDVLADVKKGGYLQ